MNKIYTEILTFLLLLSSLSPKAQDPAFSQFYANPMYTNPAFAGSEFQRATMAYRIQNFGLSGGFVTFNTSYDQHINAIKGGLGLMFTHDVAGEGVLKTTSLNASYAYEEETQAGLCFRFGVQGGFFQKSLEWDRLRWGDQIISQLGFQNPKNETQIDKAINRFNAGAGILMYSKKFYAGIAWHNINEPNQSFFDSPLPDSKLPGRYTFHGGILFPIGKKEMPKVTISPNILVMFQGKFNQIVIGFTANKGPFVTGCYYRQTIPNSDAIIGLIGFRKGALKIGYTMDFGLSSLRSPGKMASEITSIFQFGTRGKERNIICPAF